MTIYTTQIGKHQFVCGLFWQSLSRPRELKKEAAALAKKIDSDLMVLRRDQTTAQAGYAQSKEGIRRKAYSLGAVVSKTIALEGANYDGQQQPVHNWLGAFKLPDGKWAYFAVRDANFLPNGDFSGTKEEVLDRLLSDYGLGGWNVVLGNAELEDLGFHNFNVRTIEDLIPHRKSGQVKLHQWWALQPIDNQIAWQSIVLTGTMAALLIAGGYYFWNYQNKKHEEQRLREEDAARVAGLSTPATMPHPWPGIPKPHLLAEACMEKFKYLAPGGWGLDTYACTLTTASFSWSRQGSNINFLLDQVPNAVIDLNGNTASLTEGMNIVAAKDNDEKLLDRKHLLEPFISKLQLIDIAPKIAFVPPPKPLPQNAAAGASEKTVPQPQPDWDTYSFSINSGGLAPIELLSIFNQPGIRLNKLVYHGGNWSLEGVMYAKLQ